jgi:thioredoxin 1
MSSPHITDISDATFEAEVLNSDIPVLVDFWATWCAPCKAMAPHLETIAAESTGKVKVVKIDTGNNRAMAAKFGVSGLPTLLVFKGGAVLRKHAGVPPGGVAGLRKLVDGL